MFKSIISKLASPATTIEPFNAPTVAQQATLARYGCLTFIMSRDGSGEVIAHYIDAHHDRPIEDRREHRILIARSGFIAEDNKFPLNENIIASYADRRTNLGMNLDDDARIDVDALNRHFQL